MVLLVDEDSYGTKELENGTSKIRIGNMEGH